MGMTIDEAIKYYENKNVVLTEEEALANTLALNTMRKYQQLQADYENRLKADLVAMLTEIQLEIEENQIIAPQDTFYDKKLDGQFNRGISKASEIIQQKINSLKENNDV